MPLNSTFAGKAFRFWAFRICRYRSANTICRAIPQIANTICVSSVHICRYRSANTMKRFECLVFAGIALQILRKYESLEISLKYEPTHCNILQHTATHCNTLQHTATHCKSPLQVNTNLYLQIQNALPANTKTQQQNYLQIRFSPFHGVDDVFLHLPGMILAQKFSKRQRNS